MKPLANQGKDLADLSTYWAAAQQSTRGEWADPVRTRFDERHARAITEEISALRADISRADLSFESILNRLYAPT